MPAHDDPPDFPPQVNEEGSLRHLLYEVDVLCLILCWLSNFLFEIEITATVNSRPPNVIKVRCTPGQLLPWSGKKPIPWTARSNPTYADVM